MTDSPSSKTTYRTILLTLTFILVSFHFALSFARVGRYFLPLQDYISGMRLCLINIELLPAPAFKLLLYFFSEFNVTKYFSSMPSYVGDPEQLTYALVNCASFFFALLLFHQVAQIVFKSRALVFWANFLFVVAAYSIFVLNPNLNFILPYDLPSLAFMQLCTLLVLRGRWIALALVFVFATINRETSFIVVIFLASRIALGLEPRRFNALLTAITLTVIWIAIKASLFLLLKGNGMEGGVALFKLDYNIAILLKPWQWPNLIPLLIPLIVCICAVARAPTRIMLSWAATYLVGFLALFVVAQITEQRAFGDLLGFSIVSTVFFLERRGLLAPAAEHANV